jgi:transcriptional regulator with XRE-family HTH domain
MITRIRDVRRARGLTLDDVAQRCEPPTTPQTIGRLETGARTVSVGWLNRIARALAVDAQDLVGTDEAPVELKVAAVIGASGAAAPRKSAIVIPPRVMDGQVAVTVSSSHGNYRAGDELWCDVLSADDFGSAMNRDILVPRAAGRFLFGRLINRDADKLQILPLEAGGRQQVVSNPPWIAVAAKLIRSL